LFSHHGIDTLTNTEHAGLDTGPLLGAAEILAQLHRFPNIVLWLNGHTHLNAVRARYDPGNPVRGFWDVTTCAVIDWPCQTRLVEFVDRGSYLSIVCTMVDHDTPVAAASLGPGPGSPRCTGNSQPTSRSAAPARARRAPRPTATSNCGSPRRSRSRAADPATALPLAVHPPAICCLTSC
jgi:hypothetical protein